VSSLKIRKFRGDRLKTLRNQAEPKISQGELGARIGAHVTSISDWERGANEPSGRHVASLAREFDVDAEHFYGSDDDDEEPHPVPDHREVMEALHYSLGVALGVKKRVGARAD
jgi:transcriptional regulator with XRE-family HTH domain